MNTNDESTRSPVPSSSSATPPRWWSGVKGLTLLLGLAADLVTLGGVLVLLLGG